ncbi:GntR family transcriptional regulator [Actinosynnema sp. CA-299493]
MTDAAYRHLKEQVLTGCLRPGEELREARLAQFTGFGRSPIREALRRLVQEGFIEVRPRLGYRVTAITLAGVRDLFEMRLLLEPAAVDLAARRAPLETLEALAPPVQATYTQDDTEARRQFLTTNREFHVRIAHASGNDRLAHAIEGLLDEMQRLLFVSIGSRGLPPDHTHEHTVLYDALLRRDAPAARNLAMAHVEASRRLVLEHFLG